MGQRTRLLMQNLGKNADSSSPDLPLQQDLEVRSEIDSHQNKVTVKEGVRADCSESTKPAMESYASKVRGNTNTSVPFDEIPNPTIRGDKTIRVISKSTVLEEVTALEVWLDHGSEHKKPPEQLPIILQVWCDNGYSRLVQRPLEIALTGKMTRRCACFTEEELNQPGLEVYNGCDHLAKICPV
ncbi:hypothetical protein GIB67_026503 [Kingdonia uniflora]|uniref:Uncharacterized protein n=1 Tax=Kingdonia uniflora TaxID=39325 RepID=A0A7J7PBM4_9MAGN|nr:hypothetical protein GIB67_026503 [Kingdonia uniflora]